MERILYRGLGVAIAGAGIVAAVVLGLSAEASASHCWNVVTRGGDVIRADHVDNGQQLDTGSNLHWIVGYVNGVWTTLRPDRVASLDFSAWGTTTPNVSPGCTGTITTLEGETGTVEVPGSVRYDVATSLMNRSFHCEELRLVSRCGRVPGSVIDRAVENLILLANPDMKDTDHRRQHDAIKLILDREEGARRAETLIRDLQQ